MKYKSATQQAMLWNTSAGIKKYWAGKQMVWRPKGRADQQKTPQVRSSKIIYWDTYFCLYTTDGNKDHEGF